ncbi:MAG: TRAP transporter small permease [Roseitalea sp.]|jgi:TRAP-type C4-dicarboxylate transport system permease small subunit|nr:TRAP transporter small permease [Roseitalea sp.]MBO6720477.1 TRAP transporter small permease [Roseitalea sp.]MBO6743624.1 TRAP transporter small permease [Roseitalea sp.]
MSLRRLTWTFESIDRAIQLATGLAVAFSLLVMFASVAYLVAGRYLFGLPVFGGEELARYAMIYMAFLGASTALRSDQHPRLSVLYDMMPAMAKAVIRLGIQVALILVALLLIRYGYEFFDFDGIMRTPALRIRYYWIFAIVPIGGLLLLYHIVAGRFFPARFSIIGNDDLPSEKR